MSKLTKFEKLFMSSNVIMWTGSYVFDVILGLYIWQDTGSFRSLVIFKLGWVVGVLAGAIIAILCLQKFLSVKIRTISIALGAIFGLLILLVSVQTNMTLFVLGIVYGFKVGLGALPYNVIYQMQISTENRNVFSSMSNALYKLLMIVFPFLVTQILDFTGNYDIAFVIGFVLCMISLFPLVSSNKFLKSEPKTKLDLGGTLREIKESKNLQNLLKLNLLQGVYQGFTMTVLSVLGLYIINDIGNWGIVTAVITIFSVAIYYSISKQIKFEKAPIAFAISSLVFSVVSILFAVNLGLITYIIFLLALAIKESVNDRAYSEISAKIIDRRVEDREHVDEFLFFSEIPLFLGRMIPILFLFITNTSFEDTAGLSIVLLIVAFIPLSMTLIMERTALVKRFRDPFIYS